MWIAIHILAHRNILVTLRTGYLRPHRRPLVRHRRALQPLAGQLDAVLGGGNGSSDQLGSMLGALGGVFGKQA